MNKVENQKVMGAHDEDAGKNTDDTRDRRMNPLQCLLGRSDGRRHGDGASLRRVLKDPTGFIGDGDSRDGPSVSMPWRVDPDMCPSLPIVLWHPHRGPFFRSQECVTSF